jgi:hypothetical protein
LSEASAELIERSEKKEKRPGKRGGGERSDTVGARGERIKVKMVRSTNAGKRSIKRVLVEERGRGNRSIVKLYSCFSRTRAV